MTNLAYTKWCKKSEKWLRPCHMGTHLRVINSARIPTWQGLDDFQKSLRPCTLDESSLSNGLSHLVFRSRHMVWQKNYRHSWMQEDFLDKTCLEMVAISGPALMAEWSKALPLYWLLAVSHHCPGSNLVRCMWESFLQHLQLASHDLAAMWQKKNFDLRQPCPVHPR